MNNKGKDVLVVGGGITGLVVAYLAAKNGRKVRLLEAGKTFGGLLNTFEVGQSQLEYYYHHFFTHDAEINWLIEELGIRDKLTFRKTAMGVYRNNKIYDFNSPKDLLRFKPMSFLGKIRFGLTSLYLGKWAKWEKYEQVSAIDWFYKWAGKGATDNLWKPLLKVKFGPYASDIPLAWMVGRMHQRMNSRKKGEEQLGYLDGSLNTLLEALLSKLRKLGVELYSEEAVEKVRIQEGQIHVVKTASHSFTDHEVVFTIPTTYTAELLKGEDAELANQLGEIEYFGAICCILELDRSLSPIYWMNIADEQAPFGGIIEHTNFIEPRKYGGRHIVYLSRYFALHEEIAGMSKEEIQDLMLDYLPKIYPEFSKDWIQKINLFRTNTAATVCNLGFSSKIPKFKTKIKNLYLCNMAHVYPDERSVNNSIRIAASLSKAMGLDASFVPQNMSLSGRIGV